MSITEQFIEKFDKAVAADHPHPIILSWEFSADFVAELQAVATYVTATQKMFAVAGDHMTACDRVMGATHPCTCGADEARKLMEKGNGDGTR